MLGKMLGIAKGQDYLKAHTGTVRYCTISPDGAVAASASGDYTVGVWDLPKKKLRFILGSKKEKDGSKSIGHTHVVTCCSFSPDGRYLVTGSNDKTLRIWSVENGVELAVFRGHASGITCCAFLRDGRGIISGGSDRSIRCWRILYRDKDDLTRFPWGNGTVFKFCFASELTGKMQVDSHMNLEGYRRLCLDKRTEIPDLVAKMFAFFEHEGSISVMAKTKDAELFLTASQDKTAIMWDFSKAQDGPSKEAMLYRVTGHSKGIIAAAISHSEDVFATGAEDSTIRVYATKDGTPVQVVQLDSVWPLKLVFGIESDHILYCTGSKHVKLMSIAANTELSQSSMGGSKGIVTFAINRSRQAMLFGLDDHSLNYLPDAGAKLLKNASTKQCEFAAHIRALRENVPWAGADTSGSIFEGAESYWAWLRKNREDLPSIRIKQDPSSGSVVGLDEMVKVAFQVEQVERLIASSEFFYSASCLQEGRIEMGRSDCLELFVHLAKSDLPRLQILACKTMINVCGDSALPSNANYEEIRMQSFLRGWPHSTNAPPRIQQSRMMPYRPDWDLEPKTMAAAGFYFAPRGDRMDRTICFSCGVVIDGWNAEVDPHNEHRRMSPTCSFLSDPKNSKNKVMGVDVGPEGECAMEEWSDSMTDSSTELSLLTIMECSECWDKLLDKNSNLEVQRNSFHLLLVLAREVGHTDTFVQTCLPHLQFPEWRRDPILLTIVCEVLANLLQRPAARVKFLASPQSNTCLQSLVQLIPKWSQKDKKPSLLLSHALRALSYIACDAPETLFDIEGVLVVTNVLRERSQSEVEVMQSALSSLRHLVRLPETHSLVATALIPILRLLHCSSNGLIQTDAAYVLWMLAQGDHTMHMKVATIGIQEYTATVYEDAGDEDEQMDITGLEFLKGLVENKSPYGLIGRRFAARVFWSMAHHSFVNEELRHKVAIAAQVLGLGGKEVEKALRCSSGRVDEMSLWLVASPDDDDTITDVNCKYDTQEILLEHDGLRSVTELCRDADEKVRYYAMQSYVELSRKTEWCRDMLDFQVLEIIDSNMTTPVGTPKTLLEKASVECLANICASGDCRSLLEARDIVKKLSDLSQLGDKHIARHAARGLAYLCRDDRFGPFRNQEKRRMWIPSSLAERSGGLQTLLTLGMKQDATTQSWASRGILNLCEGALAHGWTEVVYFMLSERRVHTCLALVYNQSPTISLAALRTLALLSSEDSSLPTGNGVSCRRSLFLCGLVFPVVKLGMEGDLEKTFAAAEIAKNLAIDEANCQDMVESDGMLKFLFHAISWGHSAAGDSNSMSMKSTFRGPAPTSLLVHAFDSEQRTQKLLDQRMSNLSVDALMAVQSICSVRECHTTFVQQGGLEQLLKFCKTHVESNTACALPIAMAIEKLAENHEIYPYLKEKDLKKAVRGFFTLQDVVGLEDVAERILVKLNEDQDIRALGTRQSSKSSLFSNETPSTPAPYSRQSSNATTSSSAAAEQTSIDSNFSSTSAPTTPYYMAASPEAANRPPSMGSVTADGWKVSIKIDALQEKRIYKLGDNFTYGELCDKVMELWKGPLTIKYEDEDREWTTMVTNEDLDEAKASCYNHEVRKMTLRVMGEPMCPLRQDSGNLEAPRSGNSAVTPKRENSQTSSNPSHGSVSGGVVESKLTEGSEHNKEGEVLRWQLGKCIGKGAFAEVHQAINSDTGELMAVKQVTVGGSGEDFRKQASEAAKALQREIDVMRGLQHKHIVKYLGCEHSGDRLNIFLEYVPGGSIANLLHNFGALEEPVVRKYTKQILDGLDFLHSRGIVHCDIKGGNLLVTEDGVVKLADFNSSKLLDYVAGGGSNQLKSMLGTPQFMAPEVIRQTGHGKKADIWSVGCTVIQMLTSSPPWEEITNKVSLLFHIASTREPPQLPGRASSACKDFLKQCFHLDPKDRPDAEQLVSHVFIEG